jgi:NADP-dependent 3-hydroxy acid dehydrogenase YdfG
MGYKVFACARRMNLLEELCQTKNGSNIVPVCLDVTDIESVNNFKKIISDNKIDLLVNSAGGNRTSPKGSAVNYSSIDLHECMDLNMYGTFNVIQSVVPNMKKEDNPLIITLSSIAGQYITSGVMFPYHMAKNAESNLLKYLSKDLHPIRVTDLIISTVNSFEYEEMKDESMTPNDIFNVVKFLCESPQYLAINQIDLRHIGKGER